jgi:hypothetical protein
MKGKAALPRYVLAITNKIANDNDNIGGGRMRNRLLMEPKVEGNAPRPPLSTVPVEGSVEGHC